MKKIQTYLNRKIGSNRLTVDFISHISNVNASIQQRQWQLNLKRLAHTAMPAAVTVL